MHTLVAGIGVHGRPASRYVHMVGLNCIATVGVLVCKRGSICTGCRI